ncbi:MAG: hypothetical protein GTN93_05805, partial [Anaerolineae bacterium]|nr:hypothetical protein [Anaerolineae bacterium]NIQ77592.1 hypothetical protein [Anaerolineae bacterium]
MYTLLVLVGAVVAALHTLGSGKLLKLLRGLDVSPTSHCVSTLLMCMSRVLARREVAAKLAVVVPALTREEALAVKPKLWRKLYKYVASGPPEHKQMAFDVALLVEDRQAVPYLRRILRSADIRAEERER